VLLFLGRLEEAKGADLLPAIGDRLNVTLAIGGAGSLRGVLEARALADPRGLFRVLGPLEDPQLWLAGADALLLPSRLEGAPLVFLEAAAQRCPVIASAAALEALGPVAGGMARLVAPSEPAGFAAAAQALLADPAGARPLLDRAERHARSRTPQAALTKTLFLLRAAMLRASLDSPQETIA
jgi:glycosyltransferase involved in cell wall biosynthesis